MKYILILESEIIVSIVPSECNITNLLEVKRFLQFILLLEIK